MAVSPDSPADSKRLLELEAAAGYDNLGFPLLSDFGHKVISRYGIYNPRGSRANIPHPTTLVIDKRGTVRWRFTEIDYTIRPTNKQILAEVNKLR